MSLAHTDLLLPQDLVVDSAFFKLDAEPDEADQQLIAYVMVDLLVRCDRIDQAMEVAEKHLRFLDGASFSFAELCTKAGKLDAWAEASKAKGDLVAFTAAIVQSS